MKRQRERERPDDTVENEAVVDRSRLSPEVRHEVDIIGIRVECVLRMQVKHTFSLYDPLAGCTCLRERSQSMIVELEHHGYMATDVVTGDQNVLAPLLPILSSQTDIVYPAGPRGKRLDLEGIFPWDLFIFSRGPATLKCI